MVEKYHLLIINTENVWYHQMLLAKIMHIVVLMEYSLKNKEYVIMNAK